MADRMPAKVPWLLVAGSAILVAILLYVIFGAYLPEKERVAKLEAELKQVYLREAELQTKLAMQEQSVALRERAAIAERDELARRLDELQSQLPAAARAKRP